MASLFLTRESGVSDVLDEFGIEEGESKELVLIQVHHEKLVGGRQVQLLGRELLVKVADVFAVFLLTPDPDRASAPAQHSSGSQHNPGENGYGHGPNNQDRKAPAKSSSRERESHTDG